MEGIEATHTGTSRTPRYARWPRGWLAVAGGVLLAVCVLPLELIVREYLFAESIQFCAVAVVIPSLFALSAPWVPRRARLPFGGAMAVGVVFVGGCLLWRLPPVLDALARHPALQAVELGTLLLAGTWLWLQLAGSPSSPARLTRTQRAALAALAMWSIWVIAYVLGFANHAVIHGYDSAGTLGVVADQEISAALLWALSGACFIPVIAVTLLGWLQESAGPGAGPAEETETPAGRGVPAVRGWGRPPRSG